MHTYLGVTLLHFLLSKLGLSMAVSLAYVILIATRIEMSHLNSFIILPVFLHRRESVFAWDFDYIDSG